MWCLITVFLFSCSRSFKVLPASVSCSMLCRYVALSFWFHTLLAQSMEWAHPGAFSSLGWTRPAPSVCSNPLSIFMASSKPALAAPHLSCVVCPRPGHSPEALPLPHSCMAQYPAADLCSASQHSNSNQLLPGTLLPFGKLQVDV